MEELPDGHLIDRWRAGDSGAFDLLVERYQTPLLRYARGLLRHHGTAEDAVQETFLRLIHKTPEPQQNGAIGSWLFRVCRNLALDTMRTDAREQNRRAKLRLADTPPPQEAAEQTEAQQIAAHELGRLPEKEREAVRLKIYEGMGYREIGELLGVKPGTVGWLVHNGLGKLADRMRATGAF